MQKKHIIAFVVIFAIFFVVLALVLRSNNAHVEPEPSNVYHNYATNETFTTIESTNETYEIASKDYSYEHMGNLTNEQNAVKLHMNNLIYYDFVDKYYPGYTVKSMNVLDSSDKETVFVEVMMTDPDGIEVKDTAVLLYDPYTTNDFMRCVSLEYYRELYAE